MKNKHVIRAINFILLNRDYFSRWISFWLYNSMQPACRHAATFLSELLACELHYFIGKFCMSKLIQCFCDTKTTCVTFLTSIIFICIFFSIQIRLQLFFHIRLNRASSTQWFSKSVADVQGLHTHCNDSKVTPNLNTGVNPLNDCLIGTYYAQFSVPYKSEAVNKTVLFQIFLYCDITSPVHDFWWSALSAC